MQKEGELDAALEAANQQYDDMIIPPEYYGVQLTSQAIDTYNRVANLTFTRPFDTGYPTMMQIMNATDKYRTVFHFGIFNDENDTSTEHIYGTNTNNDIQMVELLYATSAIRKSIQISLISSLFGLFYMMN